MSHRVGRGRGRTGRGGGSARPQGHRRLGRQRRRRRARRPSSTGTRSGSSIRRASPSLVDDTVDDATFDQYVETFKTQEFERVGQILRMKLFAVESADADKLADALEEGVRRRRRRGDHERVGGSAEDGGRADQGQETAALRGHRRHVRRGRGRGQGAGRTLRHQGAGSGSPLRARREGRRRRPQGGRARSDVGQPAGRPARPDLHPPRRHQEEGALGRFPDHRLPLPHDGRPGPQDRLRGGLRGQVCRHHRASTPWIRRRSCRS